MNMLGTSHAIPVSIGIFLSHYTPSSTAALTNPFNILMMGGFRPTATQFFLALVYLIFKKNFMPI